ncbi:ABC transporter permease [Acidobacteriota bacterium]
MNSFKLKPPKLGDLILKQVAKYEDNVSMRGDFNEEFETISTSKGDFSAWIWYWFHLLRSFPSFINDIIYWRSIMFSNNLKTAWRFIKRHKGYSFINIVGLAFGMSIFVLTWIYVRYENSFDNFHEKGEQIYRVFDTSNDKYYGWENSVPTPPALGPTLKNDFPEVVNSARIKSNIATFVYKDQFIQEQGISADADFLFMFNFPLISGNPESLRSPDNILISQKIASKYFQGENPVGKILQMNYVTGETSFFNITGIFLTIPENSHIKFDYISSLPKELLNSFSNWNSNSVITYIEIQSSANYKELESKLASVKTHYSVENQPEELKLQPLKKIHFDVQSGLDYFADRANSQKIHIFFAVGIITLLIGCINFINMTTARSSIRMLEVGLRKTLGAQKIHLIRQFISETYMFFLPAFLASIIISLLFLPVFNRYIGREIPSFSFLDPSFLTVLIGTVLAVGMMCGIISALFLTSGNPINSVRNRSCARIKGTKFRNVLVVFQFSTCVVLLLITLTVSKQMHYIDSMDLGYSKDNVLAVLTTEIKPGYFNVFKNDLEQHSAVTEIAESSFQPTAGRVMLPAAFQDESGEEKNIKMGIGRISTSTLNFLNIALVNGRDFSSLHTTDRDSSAIINETAARIFGWEDPINKTFNLRSKEMRVIGVVKDFHFRSLHTKIAPFVFTLSSPDSSIYLMMKIDAKKTKSFIPFLGNLHKKYSNNSHPLTYFFLDDKLDAKYRKEERFNSVFKYFSAFTVFIACLGLFGLAAFTADRKTKEIGIRKILGATTSSLIQLLSWEFIRWVVLANMISWPIAYYFMRKWLVDFSYKTNISAWIFVTAAVVSISIAIFTVIGQSLKAIRKNPAVSLRNY